MTEKKRYTIVVRGKRVTVKKKVYKTYHKMREHERYTTNVALDLERSLERFAEDGVNAEYRYAMTLPSLEDQVLREELKRKLRAIVASLEDADRKLIAERIIHNKSEAEIAAALGVSQQMVSKRWRKLLGRLKKLLET